MLPSLSGTVDLGLDGYETGAMSATFSSNHRHVLFPSTAFTVTLTVSGETGGYYPATTLPPPGERAVPSVMDGSEDDLRRATKARRLSHSDTRSPNVDLDLRDG